MVTVAFLWLLWCFLHSFLIGQPAQRLAKKLMGRYFGRYRICYICFSIVSLIPVLLYQYSLKTTLLFNWPGPFRIIQVFLLLYASLLFYLGGRAYNMGYFFGIKQWKNSRKSIKESPPAFNSDGILNYVRHPWYSGGLAFVWGFGSITDISLVSKIVLSLYLVVGTILEENRLKKEIGPLYSKYCKRVNMLIPWKAKKS